MRNILIASDVAGQELSVGDLVLRASYSNITFHRIIRINRRSVSISSGGQVHTYGSGRTWVSRRYARKIEDVDLPDFNNNSAVRVWMNSTTKTTYSLYKIIQ